MENTVPAPVSPRPAPQPVAPPAPAPKKSPIIWILIVVVLLAVISFLIYENMQLKQRTYTAMPTPMQTSTPVPKQEGSTLGAVAFIRDNNVRVSENGQEKQITTDGVVAPYGTGMPAVYYNNPIFSPDKKSIAFVRSTGDNTTTRSLYVAKIGDAGSLRKLTDNVDWAVDYPRWTVDGATIYYGSPKDKEYDVRLVQSIDVASGTQKTVGQYSFGSGCGGGSDDLDDQLTWGENIAGWPVTFVLSSDNSYIVHSTNCAGRGIAIFNLGTGKDEPLDNEGWGVVFSPDGKSFAAMSGAVINVYDATTKRLSSSLKAPSAPSALLFSPDSETIYYTTTKDNKTLTFDDKVAMDTMGSSPAAFRQLSTLVGMVAIPTGKNTTIATFDAHNARPLFVDTAHNALTIAVVDNATDLFNYFSTYKTKTGADAHFPKVNIVEINLTTATATTIIPNAIQSNY